MPGWGQGLRDAARGSPQRTAAWLPGNVRAALHTRLSRPPNPPTHRLPARPRSFYASDAELYRLFKSVNGLVFAVRGR